jgi:hypothetical protein
MVRSRFSRLLGTCTNSMPPNTSPYWPPAEKWRGWKKKRGNSAVQSLPAGTAGLGSGGHKKSDEVIVAPRTSVLPIAASTTFHFFFDW